MTKKDLAVATIAVVVATIGAVAGPASAQEWRRDGYDTPPRHHHHGDGGAIVGGIAAGVIGGLIGGAIANSNGGPHYIDPPPPPRCWYEDRQVANAYDGGWHNEAVRVCQ